MWRTIFVIDHKEELKPSLNFPPFTLGGELMLFKIDKFDGSQVPFRYTITQVIFDIMSPRLAQYVHLQEVTDE